MKGNAFKVSFPSSRRKERKLSAIYPLKPGRKMSKIEDMMQERIANRQLLNGVCIDGGSLCAGIGSIEIKWREGNLWMAATNQDLTPVQCRRLASALQSILQEDRPREAGNTLGETLAA